MSFRSSVSALNHDCAARILSIPRKVPAEFPRLTLVAVSRAARQGEGLPRRPDPDSVSFGRRRDIEACVLLLRWKHCWRGCRLTANLPILLCTGQSGNVYPQTTNVGVLYNQGIL
jgi:hypothetical protein